MATTHVVRSTFWCQCLAWQPHMWSDPRIVSVLGMATAHVVRSTLYCVSAWHANCTCGQIHIVESVLGMPTAHLVRFTLSSKCLACQPHIWSDSHCRVSAWHANRLFGRIHIVVTVLGMPTCHNYVGKTLIVVVSPNCPVFKTLPKFSVFFGLFP